MTQRMIRIPQMTSAASDWEPVTGLGTPGYRSQRGYATGAGKVRYHDRTAIAPASRPPGVIRRLYRAMRG